MIKDEIMLMIVVLIEIKPKVLLKIHIINLNIHRPLTIETMAPKYELMESFNIVV